MTVQTHASPADTTSVSSRKSNRWIPVAAIGIGVVAIVGYAATQALAQTRPAPTSATGGSVTLTTTEFKFAPNALKLDAPGDLKVTLNNKGVVEHDFVVEGIDGKVLAAAGKDAQGVLKFTKEGTYTFFCSISGHRDAGMTGTLVVGAGGGGGGTQPVSAPAVAKPEVKPAIANAKALPAPKLASPINRTVPTTLNLEIEVKEVTATLADGVTYKFWTYGGSVPGPMIRVMQGDTVNLTLKNSSDSELTHSIDLHAVTGPGGGAKATQIAPGQNATFKFQAMNPGVYVYHCATPMVAHHIANGMYGLIVVEPPGGFAPVDREYYVMQGDFYIKGERGQAGHHEFALNKMLDESADYILFNGGVGAVTGANALKAKVGETVRIFFGVGGPNVTSSFHVIGEIFDRVYPEGGSNAQTNVQTTLVPTGGATIVEFKVEVPGSYILVDHSLGRLEKGGAAILEVEGADNPGVFEVIKKGN